MRESLGGLCPHYFIDYEKFTVNSHRPVIGVRVIVGFKWEELQYYVCNLSCRLAANRSLDRLLLRHRVPQSHVTSPRALDDGFLSNYTENRLLNLGQHHGNP